MSGVFGIRSSYLIPEDKLQCKVVAKRDRLIKLICVVHDADLMG